MRCGHTARHLAALAQEVVETLEAVQADESLIEAYVQAAEDYANLAKGESVPIIVALKS